MQKFEGKSFIFGVLTKILANTRNEFTSFPHHGIVLLLPHCHPSPHPTPTAYRVHLLPVILDKKEGEILTTCIIFGKCFDELTKSFCPTSSLANACHPPQTNCQPYLMNKYPQMHH
jgi:hypothetical protein